jgi:hypothetical protein
MLRALRVNLLDLAITMSDSDAQSVLLSPSFQRLEKRKLHIFNGSRSQLNAYSSMDVEPEVFKDIRSGSRRGMCVYAPSREFYDDYDDEDYFSRAWEMMKIVLFLCSRL